MNSRVPSAVRIHRPSWAPSSAVRNWSSSRAALARRRRSYATYAARKGISSTSAAVAMSKGVRVRIELRGARDENLAARSSRLPYARQAADFRSLPAGEMPHAAQGRRVSRAPQPGQRGNGRPPRRVLATVSRRTSSSRAIAPRLRPAARSRRMRARRFSSRPRRPLWALRNEPTWWRWGRSAARASARRTARMSRQARAISRSSRRSVAGASGPPASARSRRAASRSLNWWQSRR